jgi:hypothetical protein
MDNCRFVRFCSSREEIIKGIISQLLSVCIDLYIQRLIAPLRENHWQSFQSGYTLYQGDMQEKEQYNSFKPVNKAMKVNEKILFVQLIRQSVRKVKNTRDICYRHSF